MFINNTIYFILFIVYVDLVYVQGKEERQTGMLIAMLVCNSVYMAYDMQQLWKQGYDYFASLWNMTD
jgi:hypothetical protein